MVNKRNILYHNFNLKSMFFFKVNFIYNDKNA